MNYKELILHHFAKVYVHSAMRRGGRPLRLRQWETLIPEAFRSALEQEQFLKTMESLEAQQLIQLGWAHRKKRDKLRWAELVDPQHLFGELGLPNPDIVETQLRETAQRLALKAQQLAQPDIEPFFTALATHSNVVSGQVSVRDLEDIFILFTHRDKAGYKGSIRSLSVRLYKDSKRLESILGILKRLVTLCNLDSNLLDGLPQRSFPVVWLAGPFIFFARDQARLDLHKTLSGDAGFAPMGLSAAFLAGLTRIELPGAAKLQTTDVSRGDLPITILTIENKETFFSLCKLNLPFTAYIYTNGWPNSAVRKILDLLVQQGYRLYHAGDLDPEGLAIYQYLHDHYGSRPFGMNLQVFEQYRSYGRPLSDVEIRSRRFITYLSRLTPEMQNLHDSILKNRIGIEQEIIDYPGLTQQP